jgi:hypothetical protein
MTFGDRASAFHFSTRANDSFEVSHHEHGRDISEDVFAKSWTFGRYKGRVMLAVGCLHAAFTRAFKWEEKRTQETRGQKIEGQTRFKKASLFFHGIHNPSKLPQMNRKPISSNRSLQHIDIIIESY